MSRIIIHATSLTVPIRGQWRGVLLMGPSGVGKSDLALRAMESGFRLISDDYSVLWASGDHIFASAPDTIAGRMEVRGVGITAQARRTLTRVSLCVQCQLSKPERLPEVELTPVLGHDIPTLRLNPREASTVAKLLTRLRLLS
ncbi:HPr kinase/phosphorylase [Asticcacaulis sp. AND118]|uniref:HPr kinase/phosphorylase n=1 Tax=Asticcacaulis sp. AND118 TaxID=2840468 RepID=UPI001CFF8C6E|nr:HPr kinase/phosphatase C-terminal domain-containing protein [Asticcacaulis sp. AND118]UDF03829.1 HPr kinase/phosphatase C-terminal domain-containing protein [Asticcacaulis sp. AND118]